MVGRWRSQLAAITGRLLPVQHLCVPNTHPIRSRYEPVLVNQSPENLATS
jgi:hypothetical protein